MRSRARAEGAAKKAKRMEATTAQPPALAPAVTTPGEAEFRRGWLHLRKGNASQADDEFAAACQLAGSGSLAEDACFWSGASAKRAGKSSSARRGLRRFLRRFPGSARAGEAAALLGWSLYDAKRFEEAEPYFEQAAKDSVPKVRASAKRGLEALARKKNQ